MVTDMKKVFRLLFLFIFLINNYFYSQTISYIIPDIGAASMNTYIEIVAPHNANNNFGEDGFYLNNPNDNVRIEFLRPSDSTKINFGPIAVSWNGRLISTHVFVNPNVNPNDSYWENLTDEWKIPFRVYVNGSYTNTDTFYIVRPYDLGDISSNAERTLGEGSLGRRSRRGAMIVSSLILADDGYTISMVDCDPYFDGNQAYLPFVLLSSGTISGSGSNTIIEAGGNGKNGGPGGGGGGGNFCDAYLFNPNIIGNNGGNGFTGGGPGGRNNSGGGSADEFKSPGIGTGANGSSLNGIQSAVPTGYESSGGGTGNPFGLSGESCGDGYNCEPNGGYGGGSGYQQNRQGGSGGFRTEGNSTGNNNSGKIHGNYYGIPLAGGSGGASGNPQHPGECSGDGGGGGGAVRIAGSKISNISVNVNGASGGTSSYGSGGAGSGGYAELSAKLSVFSLNISAAGGNNGLGGRGLIRLDAPSMLGINYSPSGVEHWTILTSDTSKYVYKKFTLTGSKNTAIDTVFIYMKAEGDIWRLDTAFVDLRGSSKWSRDFLLPLTDSIFYVCAVADRQNSLSDTYTYIPQYLMSQAAANLLIRQKTPEIQSDSIINMHILACPGNTVDTSFQIQNTGDADLILDFQSAHFSVGNRGFSLINPTHQSSVQPSSSIDVSVRYEYQEGQSGIVSDTLLISHNDIFALHHPQRIVINVIIDKLDYNITNTSLVGIKTLDFGRVCYNDSLEKEFWINNLSDIPLNVTQSNPGTSYFKAVNGSNFSIDVDAHGVSRIKFVPDMPGYFSDQLIIQSDTCSVLTDTLLLRGLATSGEFTFQKPLNNNLDTLDIGNQCVGGAISSYFLVKNKAYQSISYKNGELINIPDYKINWTARGYAADNYWDTVYFDFWPLREGPIIAQFVLSSFECGGYSDTLIIKSLGVSAELSFLGNGDFNVIPNDFRDTITIWLTNNGSASVTITELKPINPPFSYVYVDPKPIIVLHPNDSMRIDIEFYPRGDGNFSDTVRLGELLTDSTCTDFQEFPIKGISTGSELIASTDTLDYGVLEFCDIAEDSVEISNPTSVQVTLSNERIVGPDASYFQISQSPLSPIIPPNSSVWYMIKFIPRKGPDGVKIATFLVNTDFPKNPEIPVQLRGEQENLKVNLSPPEINFGSVPIGVQNVKTIRLTNNGKIDQNLIDVVLSNPDMTVYPKAALLSAGGGFVDIDITFKPTVAGNADTDILFIFRKNCTDSITTNIYASGREGQVIVTDKIIFPLNPPCSDVWDSTYTIINTGASIVIIDSMNIAGPDRLLFSFDDSVVLPDTLDSAGTINRVVRFSPSTSPYGLKNAYIITYTNVGGKTKIDTTYLTAEKRKFLTINPQLIDFGNVIIGQTRQINYTVQNVGNSDFTIVDIIPPSYTEFTLVPNPSGTVVPAGQSVVFAVQFAPTVNSRYDDSFTLIAEYQTACMDSTSADLTGLGIPPVDTRFIISSMNDVDPRDYSISIPIKGYITNPKANVEDLEFRATISFNATLFAIKKLNNSALDVSILNDSIYNDRRFIEFSVKGLNLSNDTTLIVNLTGRPLLGNAESTPINWQEFHWRDSLAFGLLDTIPGELGIKICTAGGARLLNPGLPLTLSILPNPASNQITLKATLLEIGIHSIDLYDLQGRSTNIAVIDVTKDSKKEIELKYNVSQLSQGFYFIVIKSPTNAIVKSVFIVK